MKLLIAALGVALISASTASAVNGSPIGDYFARYTAPESRQSVRDFAVCNAARYPADVQTVLRAELSTSLINTRYPNLISGKCFRPALFKSKKLTIADGLYQSFLAEAMLRNDYRREALPVITGVSALPRQSIPNFDEAQLSERLRTDFAILRDSIVLDAVAECIARAAPESVYDFISSRPDSEQEAVRYRTLASAFAPCRIDHQIAAVPTFGWRMALAGRLYLLLDAAHSVSHQEITPHA